MRRVYLNIAVFAVLATVLIGWSAMTLFPIGALSDTRSVTVQFDESPGLRAGYEVTYLGHAIGSIDSVGLDEGSSRVVLEIDDDVDVPAAVDAAARRRSAIGEPYVDLFPSEGTDADEGPRLASGDVIPVERTTSPIQYGVLFRALDELVAVIDPDQLQTVVDEIALAVDGRGDDIRRLVVSSRDLVTTAADNGDEIEAFVDDLGTIADVASSHRDALGSSIDDLSALAETLDAALPSAEALLDEFPSSIGLLNRILDAGDASLVCTLDGLAVVEVALDRPTLASLAAVLERSAETSGVIDAVIDDDDGFVRLFLQLSGGAAVTVYPERLPLPQAPTVPSCPDKTFDPTITGIAGDVADGAGGESTGPDDDPSALPPRSNAPDDERAGGESDLAADDDPLVVRVVKTLLPWAIGLAALAALVLGGLRLVAARRSGSGS